MKGPCPNFASGAQASPDQAAHHWRCPQAPPILDGRLLVLEAEQGALEQSDYKRGGPNIPLSASAAMAGSFDAYSVTRFT